MEAFRAAGNDYCQKLQKAFIDLKAHSDQEVANITAEMAKLQLENSRLVASASGGGSSDAPATQAAKTLRSAMS